jgi:chaperone modulatory protein CbpM
MLTSEQFCIRAGIRQEVLQVWLAEGWLVPRGEDPKDSLSEVDLARARLIQDLQSGIGVNDEGIGIILDLVDQVHGLRSMLKLLIETASPGCDAVDPSAGAAGGSASTAEPDPRSCVYRPKVG